MNPNRLTALLVSFIGGATLCIASQAWAQQKYTIPPTPKAPTNTYKNTPSTWGTYLGIKCVSTNSTWTTQNATLLSPES